MISFNDVSFICEIYQRLLECESKSVIVNLSSNKGIRLLDVIEMMNEIAGYTIKVEVNPSFVRKNEIKSLTGLSDKLFGFIGEVKQKEFKDTLREMFEA